MEFLFEVDYDSSLTQMLTLYPGLIQNQGQGLTRNQKKKSMYLASALVFDLSTSRYHYLYGARRIKKTNKHPGVTQKPDFDLDSGLRLRSE